MTIRLESTVGARGQTVIPKPIRDQLRLRPGDKVWFRVEDGRMIIEREDRAALVEAFLTETPKRPMPANIDWDALYEEQFKARWAGQRRERR